jgi:hypothetical protein
VRPERRPSSFEGMDDNLIITPTSHTPYADLDLLLNESDRAWATLAPVADDAERPDTVDAMNAQILAGLVSP